MTPILYICGLLSTNTIVKSPKDNNKNQELTFLNDLLINHPITPESYTQTSPQCSKYEADR